MDWEFLARYGGLYTVLCGGGTVAVAYSLPSSHRGYALLGTIAVGMLLLSWAATGGDNTGTISGGDPAGASAALSSRGSNDVFDSPTRNHSGAGMVFYGVGLLVFGIVALATLL